jgi:hypothetical protein
VQGGALVAQLLRPLGAVQPAFRQHQRLDAPSVRWGMRWGQMAAGLQRLRPSGGVALQVLVRRPATDPKLLAKIRQRKAVRLRQSDEAYNTFIAVTFFHGITAVCVTHPPGQSVTYRPGSYLPGPRSSAFF